MNAEQWQVEYTRLLTRLEIKRRQEREVLWAQVAESIKEQLKHREIAEQLGISTKTVQRVAARLNAPKGSK